ncbi:hypothetical protein [Natrinema sp. CBA1119]|uniref:hypothetical protein n=1 Tax=Natrinema sp. CBA1119 TaxID=1608465 RepID=UPI0011457201|nr:hypothetical protein [Natrinema sp. CBA1119]
MSQRIQRRRVLQLSGATLAATAAGCLGGDSGNGNGNGENTAGTPAYAEWVATVDGEVAVSYVDMMALNDLDSEEDDSSDDSGNLEDIEDPMIGVPLSGMFVAMFTAGFGLAGTRLSNLITFDEEQTNEDEFDTSIDDLLITNETIVMTGDVVTDEIDSTVTAATESDYGAEVQFEQTSEVSGYTLYEPAGDGQQETVLGVSGNAIIQGESKADVERVIETKQGDGTRAVDEFETFERLLTTGGNGHVVFGGYSPDGFDIENEQSSEGSEQDTQFEELEDANGVVGSLTISDSESTADMGFDFDDIDDAKRDELESVLGSLGSDVSVDVDGGFVSASATYSDDALEDI